MLTQDIDPTESIAGERAVLYARVSGDDRKYATSGIESQLADCRKYAQDESRNYQIIGEFFEEPDKNTSGYEMLPELEKIIQFAQQEAFDVLVVRELDRLARNKFKQMSIENTLEQYNIRVEYVIGQYADTSEGRLLKGLMSEFSEYERSKIKERMVRGKEKAVEKGNVMIGGSIAPFGYDIKEVNGCRAFAINEFEASTVRLIFDLYVNKQFTLHGLADYLDEHHIPKPAKANNHKKRTYKKNVRGWSTGTLCRILENETYIGRWHYGKTKSVRDKLTGKRKQIARPKDAWLMVNVQPIINEVVFKLAQERRENNKRQKGKKRKHNYLLGGMLKCGHCGHSMSGVTILKSE